MKKKIFGWILLIVVVIAVVILFSKQPVKGKISYQQVNLPTPSPMEYIRYDASNFSFAYENKYELRETGSSYELVGKAGVPIQIVVTINKAKSTDIADMPGILMRRVKPQVYSEEKISWGDTEGLLFKRFDSFELTAFFLKDSWAITVAMTANTNDETGLRNEFQKLVDSMQIKNTQE